MTPTSVADVRAVLGRRSTIRAADRVRLPDFSTDNDEMLRQIVEQRPLPFTRQGQQAWP
jgi:hypothetical protein